jgi:hypothetical protein
LPSLAPITKYKWKEKKKRRKGNKMTDYAKRLGLSLWQLVLGSLGIGGGIWMIMAPFILNYGGATILDAKTKKPVAVDLAAVTISDIVCGVLLIALVGFALLSARNVALAKFRFYAGIAVIGVGVYLIAAPYLFDLLKVAEYMGLDKPNTNDQLVGILTIVLGGFALQTTFLPDEAGSGNISTVVPSALN